MRLFFVSFAIQLRRCIKLAGLFLLAAGLTALCCLGIFAARSEQPEPLQAAVLNRDSNPLTGVIFQLVQQDPSLSEAFAFRLIEEESQLTGSEAVVITLPEGFMDSIMSGENLAPTLQIASLAPAEQIALQQAVSAVSRYLSAAQAGIYSIMEQADRGSMTEEEQSQLLLRANLMYLDAFVDRLEPLEISPLLPEGFQLGGYYAASLTVFVLLAYSFLFGTPLRAARQFAAGLLPGQKGRAALYLSSFLAAWAVNLAVCLAVFLPWRGMQCLPAALPVSALAAALAMLIAALFSRPAGAAVSLGLAVFLALISGGILPLEYLPPLFSRVAPLTFYYQAQQLFYSLWGAPLLPGRIIGCTLAAAVLLAAGYLCFCRPAGKEETA